METIVIVVNAADWGLRSIAQLLEPSHQISIALDGCIEIMHPASSAYICIVDPVADGVFGDWPEILIPGDGSTAFSIDYRDPSLVESILRDIDRSIDFIVDTNFGEVMSGDAFIRRIDNAGPRWEWWRWLFGFIYPNCPMDTSVGQAERR